MKGLLAILGKGMPPKGGGPMPDDEEAEESAPASEKGEGSDAKEYAKLVVSAIKDGDDEGAADALVSLVRCCK